MQFSKVHAKGDAIVYSVSSKFKQPDVAAPYVVTLTLFSRRTQNAFYDKHVLREGESSRSVWDERKGTLTNAGSDPVKASAAAAKGIFTGSNRSTFIRLKDIDIKRMAYCMAKSMVKNYAAGAWAGGAYVAHLPVPVAFDTKCVVSYDGAGTKTYNKSMIVGEILEGAASHQLAFDINHCAGARPT